MPAVRELLTEGAARLAVGAIPDPRREIARLWAELSGSTPGDVVLHAEEPADPESRARLLEAVERMLRGEPRQYIVGSTGFRRLTLACDRRALIPRPETEGLVELALDLASGGRALDLGTGSGCVALALADEGHYHDVTGVDRSAEALALARENAAACGLRVRWLQGEWCQPVAGERFDVVVTNPPYISDPEWERLDASVREWEPRLALTGGPDGLTELRRILAEVPGVLAPSGWLVMEIDSSRADASIAAARHAGWTTVRVSDDLFGRPRYLVARRES
ncbi:MAG TPA: peptide chain release factor N(5)-glutamine methyltransferase [Gemmatimonadales bacterium]